MSKIIVRDHYRPWAWLALGLGLLGLSFWLGAALFGGGHDMGSMADAHERETVDVGTVDGQVWTCSMHPQIQRDEPGDCPICGMDLIPMAQNLNADPTILTMSPAAVAMARVQTSAVRTSLAAADAGASGAPGAAGATITLSGRLAIDERRRAVQSAYVAGRVERLFVNFEGDRVKSGQPLATLYSPELVTAQRELIEASTFRELNPPLVEAARQKLRNLKVGAAEIARLEAGGEVRTDFTIDADQSGVVVELMTRVGDYVTAGEPLMTLARLDRLWVLLDAYEGDLATIRVGDRVTFTTTALPGRTFDARVSFIDPLIDPQTRTATIRAEVDNGRGLLKPEMFVRAELTPRAAPGGRSVGGTAARERGAGRGAPVYVPATAVLWTGRRSVVYVEVPEAEVPSYEFREVTLGARVGESYTVTAGLAPGERVVTHGAFSVDAAAQLNNQFSMMNRTVGIEGAKQAGVVTGGASEVALPDYRAETPAAFEAQLAAVAKTYLAIKDALVAGNVAGATRAATRFGESLTKVDMTLLRGEPHLYWMQQLEALQTHGQDLAQANVLAGQRTQFGYLSQAMINTLKVFGASGPTLYVDHCPMAFDGEGADWVSAQEAIANPYYGDAMLKCGRVVEKLE